MDDSNNSQIHYTRRRTMKKTTLFIITILFSLSATLATGADLSQVSAKGLFQVKMSIPGENLKVGKNVVELMVRDKNGKDVPGARVTVLPQIYQHGESTLVRPKVSEKGKGSYSAENVYIEMPGHWVLKVTITKDDKTDSVTFDFPEVKREP
jgi:hypothetical protein